MRPLQGKEVPAKKKKGGGVGWGEHRRSLNCTSGSPSYHGPPDGERLPSLWVHGGEGGGGITGQQIQDV